MSASLEEAESSRGPSLLQTPIEGAGEVAGGDLDPEEDGPDQVEEGEGDLVRRLPDSLGGDLLVSDPDVLGGEVAGRRVATRLPLARRGPLWRAPRIKRPRPRDTPCPRDPRRGAWLFFSFRRSLQRAARRWAWFSLEPFRARPSAFPDSHFECIFLSHCMPK